MKIFISGFNDCDKYKNAIEKLKARLGELGFEVGVQSNDVVAHCTSLIDADIVYFIDGWFESSKCRIDFNICAKLNKPVAFQKPSPLYDEYRKTIKLQCALHEITGVTFEGIRSQNRKQELYFARVLFVWYCFTKLKLRTTTIAKIMNRGHSTMNNCLATYDKFIEDSEHEISINSKRLMAIMNPILSKA